MLWSVERLRGFQLRATDGDIGSVSDAFLDDVVWTVRYFVVKTGGWLSGRKVLLAPAVFARPDPHARLVPVSLTVDKIRNSPDVDTDKPVHRQHEAMINAYYGWPPYWSTPVMLGGALASGFAGHSSGTDKSDLEWAERQIEEGDPHLRSAHQVRGYTVESGDDVLGEVDDVLIDDDGWTVRYLVVDTGGWLTGRKVLLSPQWVQDIRWDDQLVRVNIGRDVIEGSPVYNPDAPVDRAYEEVLHNYYDRQPYWHM